MIVLGDRDQYSTALLLTFLMTFTDVIIGIEPESFLASDLKSIATSGEVEVPPGGAMPSESVFRMSKPCYACNL